MNNLKKIVFTSCRKRLVCYCVAMLLLIIFPGCHVRVPIIQQPSYYYQNPDKDLRLVGRTALIGLANDSQYPDTSVDMTKSLYLAIQKQQLFGLNLIHQTDASWHKLQLDLDANYNFQQLDDIRKTLKCDAIMIGTVTEYHPYPHLMIGLRLKLLDLKDAQLIWALEQIWDTADRTTERKIKKYFRSQKREGFAPLGERLVSFSHREFIKFIAYEVSETMKPEK